MLSEHDAKRAPVPVWLFSSPEAIEAFVERAPEIRTGHEEYDLFLVEVAGVIEECVEVSVGWIRRNFAGVSVILPRVRQEFAALYPLLAGSFEEHLGHWLLRDAFSAREALSRSLIELLRTDGFSGPLALLAADNCLLMLHHWESIKSLPTIESKAGAMQAALTAYGRASQSLAFLHQIIPFEAEMATSQACASAQRSSQVGYLKLNQRTRELWQQGVESGRWRYAEPGRKAPRGMGPRDAAKVITAELIPLAQQLLRGKQAKRGIAVGNEDEVYRWILEARGET